MSLYFLSGIEDDSTEIGARRRRSARRAARQQKRATKKAIRVQKRAKRKAKRKTRKKIAKVAAFPARAAFLAAVRINFMNLAKRLAKAYQKDKSAILNFWAKWGGKPDKLKGAISKGARVQLSAAPAAAAAFAAATPIIIALIPLLKRLGVSSNEDQRGDDATTGELKEEMNNNPDFEKGEATTGEDFQSGKAEESGEGKDDDDEGGVPSWLIPAGVGVAALVLFTRKK